jgi:hypothetical protein
MNNVFVNCRAELNLKKQWCAASDFWSIPCESERDAKRLCEIIQGAYEAGADDLRTKINALLDQRIG